MSQSVAHDGEENREPGAAADAAAVNAGARAARSEASPDEELAEEIADHLASAADELVRRGEADERAAQLALERFGDVARVQRQCWWIHHGEDFMLRTLGIALLGVLTIGITVVGYGSWRLQNSLVSRSDEFSEQLASLTATQQALLDRQRPPEITGLAYLGDKSRPAKDVEIQVYRFFDEPREYDSKPAGIVTRRLRTDAQGRFDSGVLHPGLYSILAPIQSPDGQSSDDSLSYSLLQSQPLYLATGVVAPSVELNLAASARVRLETVGIPNSLTILGEELDVYVNYMALIVDQNYTVNPVPPSSEPPRDGWPLPLPNLKWTGGGRRPEALPHVWWLPPREYSFSLSVSTRKRQTEPSPVTFGGMSPKEVKNPPFYTGQVQVTAKLSAETTAIITVRLPEGFLQDHIAAAVEERVATQQSDGADKGVAGWDNELVQKLAREIKPDVTVTLEESAAAEP